MILAAHQPQFCPWLGYFDKMRRADIFVILDDIQFEKNNWQNRNRIKTMNGPSWFTVPVSFHFGQKINEIEINNNNDWQKKYRMTLTQNYAKAAGLSHAGIFIEELFGRRWDNLIDLNLFTMDWLAKCLQATAPKTQLSSKLNVSGQSTERLVNLCREFGADTYLSGGGGRKYMELDLFEKAGIKVMFQDYKHPVYSQFHGEFVPQLSALDLVLQVGHHSAHIAFPEQASALQSLQPDSVTEASLAPA